MRYFFLIIAFLFITIGPVSADSISFYHGQGVDSDLLQLGSKAMKNELVFENSRLNAVGYLYEMNKPDLYQKVLDRLWIPKTIHGVEGILVKHYGLQDNVELDIAYDLQFNGFELLSTRVKFGIGMGLSYAFSKPTYEDGPADDPNKRYRFQNYNSYEIEVSHLKLSNWAFVGRVHHRSGIYGLIAPRKVGSNFLTLGVRYRF